jgi:hypothetical protein
MKKLRGIIERESQADALHDGSQDLGCSTYELVLVYGNTEVPVRVIIIALLKVFFKRFEIIQEGIVCLVGVLFGEVRLV